MKKSPRQGYYQKWYSANREKVLAYQRMYRKKHLTHLTVLSHEHYEKNKKRLQEYQRIYYIRNKAKVAARAAAYRKRNHVAITVRKGVYKREIKKLVVDALGGKCSSCGYSKCVAALHIHHKPGRKERRSDWFTARWRAKLKDLELLCANCHAEHHYDEAHYE